MLPAVALGTLHSPHIFGIRDLEHCSGKDPGEGLVQGMRMRSGEEKEFGCGGIPASVARTIF